MFHLHIKGSGCDDYWNHPGKEAQLMGDWFLQLKFYIKLTLLF